MHIQRVPIGHPHAVDLVARLQAYFAEIYGGPDETQLRPTDFEGDEGAFFVGYVDGVPVATGAWRLRPDMADQLKMERPAEIKRMYVVPEQQHGGLARRMLVHLEASALAEGATHLVLETGAPQRAAVALYEAAGYSPIEPYGLYRSEPSVRCFARALLAA